jgi:hypothetical protein
MEPTRLRLLASFRWQLDLLADFYWLAIHCRGTMGLTDRMADKSRVSGAQCGDEVEDDS